jgi:hypothetical protein
MSAPSVSDIYTTLLTGKLGVSTEGISRCSSSSGGKIFKQPDIIKKLKH